MKYCYARHSNNLDTLIDFYQNIIGLEKRGGFKDHNGYDGVFDNDIITTKSYDILRNS